jgi:predicted nucleic acid-binding protein
MTKLDDALMGVTRLGFDTSPIIDHLLCGSRSANDALVTEIFQRVSNGAPLGVTSTITLSEVLVQPIIQGQTLLQREYRDLLLRSRNFSTSAISATIAELGAELRAQYRLRTPDALQIATAIEAGCEAFLSNDAGLRRVTELRVLILDDLEL